METLAPLSGLHGNHRVQEVELERDANVQAYRRRMVGDLKIHHTCSGDDDILNEAKITMAKGRGLSGLQRGLQVFFLPGSIREPGWLG